MGNKMYISTDHLTHAIMTTKYHHTKFCTCSVFNSGVLGKSIARVTLILIVLFFPGQSEKLGRDLRWNSPSLTPLAVAGSLFSQGNTRILLVPAPPVLLRRKF